MKNKLLASLLLIAFLLTSCGVLFDTVDSDKEATATVEVNEEVETDASAEETPTEEETIEPFTNADNPCSPFFVLDTTLTTPYPGLPEITEDDYTVGPDDAVLTFMEYSEPQCPYCAQLEPILTEFQAMYPDDVRLVFRFRPFQESFHDKSYIASQAMVAAGEQGKFTELKNFLFERQYQDAEEEGDMDPAEFWAGIAPADFDAWLEERVPDLGIDAEQLLTDMYREDVVAQVKAWGDEATALGITGTPTLFINGYKWPENSRGTYIFSIYLRLLKSKENLFDACPATVIDENKSYTATLATNKGDITVELYPDKAPVAVNSFVYLAQQGWYRDLPILATSDFVLSGDPSDTGSGGPGYAYLDEVNDLTFDEAGMLATYSIWPGYGYNGSTFFINKVAWPDQESYVIFGKVIEGLDILNDISIREDNIYDPVEDQILDITITEE